MHNSRTQHLEAAYRILSYPKSTPGKGSSQKSNCLTLEAYTNVDWAGSKEDRKSTLEYCIFPGKW